MRHSSQRTHTLFVVETNGATWNPASQHARKPSTIRHYGDFTPSNTNDMAKKIQDLKFDDHNFNDHTAEGMALLEKSIKQNGFGRSVLVDKDDNLLSGNGVVESAIKAGKTKIKVVETTGDELVVVKRTDLDINTKEGRYMALADNVTAHQQYRMGRLPRRRDIYKRTKTITQCITNNKKCDYSHTTASSARRTQYAYTSEAKN